MALNIKPPSQGIGSTEERVKGLYSYLYQLAEQLNIALAEAEKSGAGTLKSALSGGSTQAGGKAPESTASAYQQLRTLITKTATEVTGNIQRLVREITQDYVAQSEYGTYSEYLNAKITGGADGVLVEWDAENGITANVGEFAKYIANSDVYMRAGIVKYNDDGTVEAGVVIGKELTKVTIDGKEIITSQNVYSLLTADTLSFWQDGVKRAEVGLEEFFVNKAYIDEVTTSLLQSDTFGAQLALRDDVLSAIAGKINLQANDSVNLLVSNSASGLQSQIDAIPGKISLAVENVQVGGRNYVLGTGDAYTAQSGGAARTWLYPWSCADAATARGLYGKTVTVSFDYDQAITSGSFRIQTNSVWGTVKEFTAGTAAGQRFEGTFDLPVPEAFSTEHPESVLYIDGTWNGSVTFLNLKLETGDKATDWTPAPEDPAGGVKTSSIEIADDHIDVSSGGSVNIRAGSALNVNSGSFDVVTGDFKMSLAKGDGTNVVMDIDDDGDTTFKAIHAGNVREAEYGYAYFTTATMGSLAALAEYLSRTDARIAEYSMSGDEYGNVTFDNFNGVLKITGNGRRLPGITVGYGFSGTLWIADGYLTQQGAGSWCLDACCGKVLLTNCWFTGSVTYGLHATHAAELRWYRGSSEGLTGYSLNPFIWTQYGGVAYYYGSIPGGGIWSDSGWVHASETVTVVSGDGGSGSAASTASVAGALGYYGSSNGWHGSECFQGYTNAKGRAYGCLSFDLSGVGTIVSAKLTLHRKSGVGLNRKANVTVYGTTAARGSNPANGLTGAYASGTELISWDAYATLDVTAAAQALKAGTIAQLVLYTGETGVYSGKVYSYHYAQFDSASLEVVYTA